MNKILSLLAVSLAFSVQALAAPTYTVLHCVGGAGSGPSSTAIDKTYKFGSGSGLLDVVVLKGKTYTAQGTSAGGVPGITLSIGERDESGVWAANSMSFVSAQGPRLTYIDNSAGIVFVCTLE